MGCVLLIRMMYPIEANNTEPMMNKARCLRRSDKMATASVVAKAKAYGGMVSSWAFAAVYPRELMIVGCMVLELARFKGFHSEKLTMNNE